MFHDDDGVDALAPDEEEDEDPFAVRIGDSVQDEDEDDIEDDNPSDEEMNGAVDEDDEIESDEAFGEGEEEQFKSKGFVFRGSGQALESLPAGDSDEASGIENSEDTSESANGRSDVDMEDIDSLDSSDEGLEDEYGSDEVDEDDVSGSDDDDEDGDQNRDEGEDEETARPQPSALRSTANSDREKLKSLIANDTAALASSLSASQSADAKKGAAVRTQYQTFDRLLDARIKLQKALTASGDLPGGSSISDEKAETALQKAEDAALRLYSTIESLRHTILDNKDKTDPTNDKKRKRPDPAPPSRTTSSADLWTRLSSLETTSLPLRRQTLDKWSTKTRAPGTRPVSKLTGTDATQTDLTSVLDTYLHSESDKLFQAATSAPTSSTKNLPYDDNQFYQSLLRDLIASRSATTTNTNANSSSVPVLPTKLHTSGNARQLDTRASKGRKIRYTVHPQLENFMAGEGRGNSVGQWNEGAVREFFGSLLGQRGLLLETVVGDGIEEEGQDAEVEALRLFRT